MSAKEYLTAGITCAVIQNDVVYQATQSGIRPLLDWLNETPCPLYQADVADRVVGRAAALLFRYAGIKTLYTEIISEHALRVLQDSDILVTYQSKVDFIMNRNHDGMCPMESKVLEVDDPKQAYEIFK